jgi:hypothetical protein
VLTASTSRTFAADRASVEASWFTPEQRETLRTENAKRHADYEAHFDTVLAALHVMTQRRLSRVLALLATLGGSGCLSGTYEYTSACELLEKFGVPRANAIFKHDRAWLVREFGG